MEAAGSSCCIPGLSHPPSARDHQPHRAEPPSSCPPRSTSPPSRRGPWGRDALGKELFQQEGRASSRPLLRAPIALDSTGHCAKTHSTQRHLGFPRSPGRTPHACHPPVPKRWCPWWASLCKEREPVPAPAHGAGWEQLPTHIWEEEEEEGSRRVLTNKLGDSDQDDVRSRAAEGSAFRS